MQLTSPHIPVAVYREFAAHLQQIEGIRVTFLTPIDRSFSYTESQLGGIEISGVDLLPDRDRRRLDQIVEYYADRFGVATSNKSSGEN
jgi:hypothetical protein